MLISQKRIMQYITIVLFMRAATMSLKFVHLISERLPWCKAQISRCNASFFMSSCLRLSVDSGGAHDACPTSSGVHKSSK